MAGNQIFNVLGVVSADEIHEAAQRRMREMRYKKCTGPHDVPSGYVCDCYFGRDNTWNTNRCVALPQQLQRYRQDAIYYLNEADNAIFVQKILDALIGVTQRMAPDAWYINIGYTASMLQGAQGIEKMASVAAPLLSFIIKFAQIPAVGSLLTVFNAPGGAIYISAFVELLLKIGNERKIVDLAKLAAKYKFFQNTGAGASIAITLDRWGRFYVGGGVNVGSNGFSVSAQAVYALESIIGGADEATRKDQFYNWYTHDGLSACVSSGKAAACLLKSGASVRGEDLANWRKYGFSLGFQNSPGWSVGVGWTELVFDFTQGRFTDDVANTVKAIYESTR